jgi:hypothetical protein
VPLDTPLQPQPIITKVPPGAKTPPADVSPLVNAPVRKVKVPRFDPSMPPNEVKVEVPMKPALVPVRVPPRFPMSMLLAHAAIGSDSATRAITTTRFITSSQSYLVYLPR